MDPGPLRDFVVALLGVCTGVLSAAFGIGGAVLSTPGIRALGTPALVAVGTTLPSIIPGAASGSARYRREGLVDWAAVLATAPLGVAAAVAGSLLSHEVPGDGHWLMVVTAVILAVTAIRLARGGHDDEDEEDEPPPQQRRSLPLFAGVGAMAGLLSGLLGVGGGTVLVPAFSEIVRLPLKVAIATSLACVGIFAIPGTITHAALGGIDWRVALWLTAGAIPGARLGALLTIRAQNRRLRLAVGVLFGLIAAGYGVGEVAAAVG